MVVTVYLDGWASSDGHGHSIVLPLSSAALLLVVNYAQPSTFRLMFVKLKQTNLNKSSSCVSISRTNLNGVQHELVDSSSVPDLVSNVVLPAVMDPAICMVRSGLCVVIRHVIKVAHSAAPGLGLTDLLGFRQGSLRMCAEVSGWTKLCEVDLPNSVGQLVDTITRVSKHRSQEGLTEVELPADLIRLENHYQKPPKVHNDDRRRRSELSKLQADFADPEKRADVLQCARAEGSNIVLERMIELSHGWKKIRVQKEIGGDTSAEGDTIGLEGLPIEGRSEGVSEERLSQMMKKITYLDIKLLHLYSEGVEMTIADLCLFSYLYFLLEAWNFSLRCLEEHFPRILHWLRHMVTLPRLESGATLCGFKFGKLKQALLADSAGESERKSLCFVKPEMEEVSEDDMELSRRCRSKHKAIKPEVIDAISKMKGRGIEPVVGIHPRGSQVGLEWDTFPSCVHPREGEVPIKRAQRKCQQLENLVTAVLELAQPGDVIIDFCSGGGHLGIAIAHLLPLCKVYLVENKEESLAKAQSRMAALKSNNITLFQCNIDYFVGKFDVGVCLHACGSATDMVLHQCLRNQAAFVICPCCYGSIQRTHLLDYPRSRLYQDKNVSYLEFLTLGHAADQTEFNIVLEQQGRQCMNLVDFDRSELAREAGYTVTLTSLQPLTCSPKNNLLIGHSHPVASS